jgi:hypothetical protein
LALRVSKDEKFALATAIKVAIDKAASNPNLALPDGITDTLALAQNTEAAQAYVEAIEETPEFEEAYEEIISDPELVNSELDTVLGTYFITDSDNPVLSFPGKAITLNQDNTATYSSYRGVFEATWAQNGNKITLSFADGEFVNTTIDTVITVNGDSLQIDAEITTHELSYLPLNDQANNVTFEVTNLYSTHYPNGEVADVSMASDEPIQSSAVKLLNAKEVQIDNGENHVMSLPMTTSLFSSNNLELNTYSLSADTFTFLQDGSGSTKVSELSFTWLKRPYALKQDINELVITFENGVTQAYIQITDSSSQNLYAVTGMPADASSSILIIDSGDYITDEDKFDIASVPGIYTYGFDGNTINEFWWELWPDGKAYTINAADDDNDGMLAENEVLVMYGNWEVTAQGELIISRWRNRDYSYPGCFSEQPECFLYNQRTWSLFEREGNTLHLSNQHDFDFDNNGGNGPDGIFDYFALDNRRVSKSSSRPVSVDLPELSDLPNQPPQTFVNLVDPANYVGQTLYGADQDALGELDDVTLFLTLNEDKSYELANYSYSTSDLETKLGVYQIFSDNSITLNENATNNLSLLTFLTESNDVVLSSYFGLPAPYFDTENKANAYEAALRNRTAAISFTEKVNTQLVLADREENGQWVATYLEFTDSELNIYTDNTFTTVENSQSYSLNADGSIQLDGNKLFIPLQTDGFAIVVTDVDDNLWFDYNYFFEDVDAALYFIENANILLNTAKAIGDY